jgi:hypothetical protein
VAEILRGRLTWIIVGAVVAVVVVAGIDALRSSLRETRIPVETAPAINRSTVVSECNVRQMEAAIEVRKPDNTRPVWNQRDARGWRAWQRTPAATLVMRNVGSSDCILSEGTFDFGIRDRTNRWMARWNGDNVFPGLYAPGQERSFSLPNVFSCDRPGPFRAIATVGDYSARLDDLAYREVTCTSGRL